MWEAAQLKKKKIYIYIYLSTLTSLSVECSSSDFSSHGNKIAAAAPTSHFRTVVLNSHLYFYQK